MKKMKARSTIQKELRKCERIFAIRSTGSGVKEWEHELYGVQQALSWVLGEEVMPPVKSTQCTIKDNEKGRSVLQ
jgi:hypothetical protein